MQVALAAGAQHGVDALQHLFLVIGQRAGHHDRVGDVAGGEAGGGGKLQRLQQVGQLLDALPPGRLDKAAAPD